MSDITNVVQVAAPAAHLELSVGRDARKGTAMENTVYIGPCKCGGYGVTYNEEWEAKLGRCHDDLETVLGWAKQNEVGTGCSDIGAGTSIVPNAELTDS